MKTRDILAKVAAGEITQEEAARLIAAMKRAQEPIRNPMPLQELRLLLEGMEGKTVRGRLVSSASVTVEVNSNQFSVIVNHAVPGRVKGETAEEALRRVIFSHFCSACVCYTDDELRAVFLDPRKGNWYVDDELQP